MAVYTVHEPPARAGAAAPDPGRFLFVRDGFSFWAFLFAPLWMAWHWMWLVLLGYLVAMFVLDVPVRVFGGSVFALALVGILVSLLIGLEAGTLRRFTLSRRGWKHVGIVSGDDREDAERRFFDFWLHQAAPAAAATSAPIAAAAPMLRTPQTPGIIGLFPEPGAQR